MVGDRAVKVNAMRASQVDDSILLMRELNKNLLDITFKREL